MTRFFRKIRQRLLNNSKIARYLFYAIGEIILVVIGILIALYLNNLNANRKDRVLEKSILSALRDEVSQNIATLDVLIQSNLDNKAGAEQFALHTGPQKGSMDELDFARTYSQSFKNESAYRPSDGVIKDILNSGKLSLIQNPVLRTTLSSWESRLNRIRFQENSVERTRQRIYSLLTSYGNFRMLLDLTREDEHWHSSPDGKFTTKNANLLQLPEFENQLLLFIGTSAYLDANYYQPHKVETKMLLDLITQELDLL